MFGLRIADYRSDRCDDSHRIGKVFCDAQGDTCYAEVGNALEYFQFQLPATATSISDRLQLWFRRTLPDFALKDLLQSMKRKFGVSCGLGTRGRVGPLTVITNWISPHQFIGLEYGSINASTLVVPLSPFVLHSRNTREADANTAGHRSFQ